MGLATRRICAAVIALVPTAAAAASVEVPGEVIGLAVTTTAAQPDRPTLGGEAVLKANLDTLQTSLQLGVQAGTNVTEERALWSSWTPGARTGWWNSGRAGIGVTWAPLTNAKLDLQASNQLRRELALGDPIWTGSTDRRVQTHHGEARITASITPVAPLSLEFGGEASEHTLKTTTETYAGVGSWDVLETQSQKVFTTLRWRPIPKISLEGEGRAESMDVRWAGIGGMDETYAFFRPRLAGTVTPWKGTSLRLGVERAVSPLNSDQFVRFAQAADDTSGLVFAPDQEWRYQATLQQRIAGDIDLSATLTLARLQSVTDLGPVGATQAPMDIGGGERRQLEASLAAPVQLFGLPSVNLKARTAWRDSEVADPFTQASRSISGEARYDAELVVSRAAPGASMDWGLTARATGPTAFYQMSQVTTRSATAGLGGYVAYSPGDLSIRLQLDNVVGGVRTDRDIFFTGSRDVADPDRIEERRSSDRAVRLVLSRPL